MKNFLISRKFLKLGFYFTTKLSAYLVTEEKLSYSSMPPRRSLFTKLKFNTALTVMDGRQQEKEGESRSAPPK